MRKRWLEIFSVLGDGASTPIKDGCTQNKNDTCMFRVLWMLSSRLTFLINIYELTGWKFLLFKKRKG